MTAVDMFTVSVNGDEPVPCEIDAGIDSGLKYLRLTAYAALFEYLGECVNLRLEGGSRAAEGRGIVTAIDAGYAHWMADNNGARVRTTIECVIPLRMLRPLGVPAQ